jgi:hypothetical protein
MTMEGSQPDRLFTQYVTGNYFTGLGVRPALGRLFKPGEGVTPGADPYMVLSYAYWQEHFGGDPHVIGRHVALDGKPVTIIGVAPQSYRGLSSILEVPAYLPLAMIVPIEKTPLADFNKVTNRSMQVFGRLVPGVTARQADAALAVVARDLAAAHPRDDRDVELKSFSLEAGRVSGQLDQDNSFTTVSAKFGGAGVVAGMRERGESSPGAGNGAGAGDGDPVGTGGTAVPVDPADADGERAAGGAGRLGWNCAGNSGKPAADLDQFADGSADWV